MLSKSITNTIALVEMAHILCFIDLFERYNWAMSSANLDVANE